MHNTALAIAGQGMVTTNICLTPAYLKPFTLCYHILYAII